MVPSKHDEVPVIGASSRGKFLDVSTEWWTGVAPVDSDFTHPSQRTIDRYYEEARYPVSTPEKALVGALILLEGLEALDRIDKNLKLNIPV